MKDIKKARAIDTTLEVVDKAKDIVELVREGYLAPTKAFILLKKIEEKSKELREEIKSETLEELGSIGYESKSYKIEGGTLELRNSAGRWDFSHIEDIVALERLLKEYKERSKEAYKKSLKGLILVTEDGEEVTPAKFKEGKETIVTKLD
jgi:uncharacterized protein YnzC (UPF0291/DUF896 family)